MPMNKTADPILTIFTPAYNRAHTLPRTYESLCRQSCKDFIWLIVDDGSTDNTAALVQQWQSRDNGFEIQYIYKENGGMHTAHNAAYANIHTELNTCIDSDDMLADGAVEKILNKWAEVKDNAECSLVFAPPQQQRRQSEQPQGCRGRFGNGFGCQHESVQADICIYHIRGRSGGAFISERHLARIVCGECPFHPHAGRIRRPLEG